MLEPSRVFEALRQEGVGFFAGVPDSLLKDFSSFVTDNVPASAHVITANEGSAVAMAAGYHLATGGLSLVYLQNAGLGNVVNPILSLADREVYGLPMLLLVGWRGEPGITDEPQHIKQGRVTLALLHAMEVPYRVLAMGEPSAVADIAWAARTAREHEGPVAIVVRRGTFATYALEGAPESAYPMLREEAIEIVVAALARDDIVVSTTGMISRELSEVRRRRGDPAGHDFLTVGSMGHASAIAHGIALNQRERRVVCLDGDGAMLMHLGALAVLGQTAPPNFRHVVINNGCHDSVGGQPTVAFGASLGGIARACGYEVLEMAEDPSALRAAVERLLGVPGPAFLEVRVRRGSREDLGRPTSPPQDNKRLFMDFLGVAR